MAKEKAKESRSTDRHASGFMVRLPKYLRGPLEELQAKHRRTLTTEIVIAIEERLKAEGVAFENGD